MRHVVSSLAIAAACAAMSVPPILPIAFVNANAGSKLYISTTAEGTDLNQAGFEALSWVEIKAVGARGETGASTNILTYDTWDTDVTQKAKGMTNAGDPDVELARIPTDPGQILLRAAALTNLNYAFKETRNDNVIVGSQPTIIYNRGLVTGPKRPGGRNEDFDLEVFTLGLQQREVIVNPTAGGVGPALTVLPTISGTAQVGQTLTATTGTFTGDATITYAYQWFSQGQLIAGATNSTYVVTSGELGEKIHVRVVATNASGSATGNSILTGTVIA